jgi:hypothetical protein
MTQEEIDKQIKAIRDVTEKATQSKETARQFLIDAGIVQPTMTQQQIQQLAQEILNKHYNINEGFTNYERKCFISAMVEMYQRSTLQPSKWIKSDTKPPLPEDQSYEPIPEEISPLPLVATEKEQEEEKTGVGLIADERQRQIQVEGWSAAHDLGHYRDDLAIAGALYALPESERLYPSGKIPKGWPWEEQWWKPCPDNRIRELVKAGALIAAEIDRLQSINIK